MDNLTLFPTEVLKERGKLRVSVKTSKERSDKIRALRASLVWPANYIICKDIRDLGRVAREISRHGEFAFDTETSGLNPWRDTLYCISVYVGGNSYLINFEHPLLPSFQKAQFKEVLGPYFESTTTKRIGFNLNFDCHFLEEQAGVRCGEQYFDASLGIWLLREDLPSKKLKVICETLLGIPGETYDELFGKTAWIAIDPQVAAFYACKDAELHWKIYKWERDELAKVDALNHLMFDLEMPVQNIFYEVERTGILVDQDYIHSTVEVALVNEIDTLLQKMYDLGLPKELDLNSPEQLSTFLYVTLGLPRVEGSSTRHDILESLSDAHPLIPVLLEYRAAFKLKTGFVDSLQQLIIDGRVHPSIRTIGSETGRVSCVKPNLLNMPAKAGPVIRKAFLAPDGFVFVSKDLKGQELRINAALTGDNGLTEVAVSGDIYAEAASIFFNMPVTSLKKGMPERDLGKKAVLAWQYGAREGKLASIFESTKDKARAWIEGMYRRFPCLKSWQDRQIKHAKSHGYVETILGRRRHINFKAAADKWDAAALERECINTPIQGSAADQVKLAFLLCYRHCVRLGYKSRPTLTIHDEILFTVAVDELDGPLLSELDYIMEHAIIFDVPMETTTTIYTERWGDERAA